MILNEKVIKKKKKYFFSRKTNKNVLTNILTRQYCYVAEVHFVYQSGCIGVFGMMENVFIENIFIKIN